MPGSGSDDKNNPPPVDTTQSPGALRPAVPDEKNLRHHPATSDLPLQAAGPSLTASTSTLVSTIDAPPTAPIDAFAAPTNPSMSQWQTIGVTDGVIGIPPSVYGDLESVDGRQEQQLYAVDSGVRIRGERLLPPPYTVE